MPHREPRYPWSLYVVVLAPAVVLPILTNAISDELKPLFKGRLPLAIALTVLVSVLLVRAQRAENVRRSSPVEPHLETPATRKWPRRTGPIVPPYDEPRRDRWAAFDGVGAILLSVVVTVLLIAFPPDYRGFRSWWVQQLHAYGYDGYHYPFWMILLGIAGGCLGVFLVFATPYWGVKLLTYPRPARYLAYVCLPVAAYYWVNVIAATG